MAITATALTATTKHVEARITDATPFIVNAYSADLSGTEEIKAAPSAGQIVIDKISVICAVKDITVTIGAGETGGAVTAVLWGPLSFVVEETAAGYIPGRQYTWEPAHQIFLPATTALTVDASGAGDVLIMVEGLVVV